MSFAPHCGHFLLCRYIKISLKIRYMEFQGEIIGKNKERTIKKIE